MTNPTPDLVPQGSIPQVLAKAEALLARRWDYADSPLYVAGTYAVVIRELLTALRSLPPVPMQQVLAEGWIERWRQMGRSGQNIREYAGGMRAAYLNCADDLEAALRSLTSPQHDRTQE